MTDIFTYEITNTKEDIKNIVDTINEYGICVINNYQDVSGLKEDTLKSLIDVGGDYEFGYNVRLGSPGAYSKYPSMNSYFNNNFFKEILDSYCKEDKYDIFNKCIFATKDFKFDGELGRNGFLHFDRLRCFKFFVYLTDVDKNCGPFSIVPKSHIKGKELRTSSWNENSDYGGVKNRIKLDFPDIYNEEDIVQILGDEGTLIMFDTDLFHKGGKTNGKERLIVRSHTYLKNK